MAKLRKTGHPVAPVVIAGRAIATTFWGRAWCDNMESYHDYESRLPRGRTYVRNGSVVDLQIAPGRVTALVSGSDLYKVTITMKEAAKSHWQAICRQCVGAIDSLVELLQGRFSKAVMELLCRQQTGLFPRPSDIRFTCSCPDHALMCKHVAAVLYGVGARLDQQPELLFRLRMVDETELVAQVGTGLQLSKTQRGNGKVLQADDMSALFGIDMAEGEVPPAEVTLSALPRRPQRKESVARPIAGKGQLSAGPTAGKQRSAVLPPKEELTLVKKRGATTRGKLIVPKGAAADKAPKALPPPTLANGHTARASLSTPTDMPPPSRGKRQVSAKNLPPARDAKQKPVKWW
jgi:uncharacterized Zn finger protein